MKKFLPLLLFLPFILFQENLCAQWTWVTPEPQGNKLRHLAYFNTGKLLAAGGFGTIISSTNDGIGWNVVNNLNNVNSDITSLYKFNNSILYAGTFNSRLLKSTDQGLSWQLLTSIQPDYGSIDRIFITDLNIGYVIITRNRLFKSTNTGNDWFLLLTTNQSINDVYFFDQNTGILAGGTLYLSSLLLRTTNGGLNWYNVSPNSYAEISRITFPEPTHGYAAALGTILKTTNAGINWFVINLSGAMNFTDIQFLDRNTGFATNYNNNLYKTTNGGLNWETIPVPYFTFNTYGLNTLYFADPQSGYVLKGEHILLKTTNGGFNWLLLTRSINDYAPVRAIQFLDNNTGFIGSWIDNQRGIIKRTTDGAASWATVYFGGPGDGHVFDLQFPSINTGYAVGGNSGKGYVYKTSNGGNNWNKIDSMGNGYLHGLYFIDNNTGFALGYSSEIFRTVDGGMSWTTHYSEIGQRVNSITFTDVQTGYACGGAPVQKLLKTTDTGLNWNLIYSTTGNFFNSIFFTDNSIGYIAGRGILKTTDSGITWEQMFTGELLYFQKVYFLNQNTGFAYSQFGRIFKTTNGGNNWWEQSSPTSYFFYDIFFLNDNTGLIVGDQGTILKTTNGGGPLAVSKITSEIPAAFRLHQNYPNPFNPVTNLRFEISELRFVRLTVYDALGREVEILVNEELKPGTYEIQWNAADFPSGVYFYKLEAGDASTSLSMTQTKRMVLIK